LPASAPPAVPIPCPPRSRRAAVGSRSPPAGASQEGTPGAAGRRRADAPPGPVPAERSGERRRAGHRARPAPGGPRARPTPLRLRRAAGAGRVGRPGRDSGPLPSEKGDARLARLRTLIGRAEHRCRAEAADLREAHGWLCEIARRLEPPAPEAAARPLT